MKLEVGMYARLQNDAENIVIINRIANVFKNTILTENDGSIYQGEYTKENVIKASYNIIDILEVGDYVNGYIVEEIKRGYDGKIWIDNGTRGHDEGGEYTIWKRNEDIKSIVTKEQFKQMEYKVE